MLAADTRACRAGLHPDSDPHATSIDVYPGQADCGLVSLGLPADSLAIAIHRSASAATTYR